MGCAQSTVKEQVQDTTVAAPPASTDVQIVAAEAATTSAEEAAAAPAAEEAAAPVAEEAAAPVEEAAAAPVEEVAAPVEEAAAAPVKEVAAPVEEPGVEDEVVAEVEVVSTEVEVAAESENEAGPVDETETVETGLVFVSSGVSFGDKGVAFYNYQGTNSEDPAQDVKISKRFNDFKALHAEVATIMANEANVAPEHQDKFQTYPALPALPKTSLFKGRSNKKQTEERDEQFLKILNAIARHPIAVESPKFKAFLA